MELSALLRDARERAGLSQALVASVLGVHRPSVSEIEAGRRGVGAAELSVLAELYGLNADEALGAAGAVTGPMPMESVRYAFRRETAVSESAYAAVDRFVVGWQTASAEDTGSTAAYTPPRVSYDMRRPDSDAEALWQGETVAQDERRRLGLAEEPIADFPTLLREQGVYVGTLDEVPQRELDGVYVRHRAQSAIGLNFGSDAWGPYRARFTAAHEYAHYLLRDVSAEQLAQSAERGGLVEARADAFAGAFLMPRDAVLQSFNSHPVTTARRQASSTMKLESVRRSMVNAMQYFGVSNFALLRRLVVLGVITAEDEVSLREEGLSEVDASKLGLE